MFDFPTGNSVGIIWSYVWFEILIRVRTTRSIILQFCTSVNEWANSLLNAEWIGYARIRFCGHVWIIRSKSKVSPINRCVSIMLSFLQIKSFDSAEAELSTVYAYSMFVIRLNYNSKITFRNQVNLIKSLFFLYKIKK